MAFPEGVATQKGFHCKPLYVVVVVIVVVAVVVVVVVVAVVVVKLIPSPNHTSFNTILRLQ